MYDFLYEQFPWHFAAFFPQKAWQRDLKDHSTFSLFLHCWECSGFFSFLLLLMLLWRTSVYASIRPRVILISMCSPLSGDCLMLFFIIIFISTQFVWFLEVRLRLIGGIMGDSLGWQEEIMKEFWWIFKGFYLSVVENVNFLFLINFK